MSFQTLAPIVATIFFYLAFHVLRAIYRELYSPLRHISGPRNPSLLFGNFRQMFNDPHIPLKWRDEFGPVFRIKNLFNMSEVYIADVKALNHITNNGTIYQPPDFQLAFRNRALGKGLLTAGKDDHKRQRRILSHAFGVAQIRHLTDIFVDKSIALRDIWLGEVNSASGVASIDIYDGLRRMTLDSLGQAGFNYDFHSLDGDSNGKRGEMNQVFQDLFHSPGAARENAFRLAQAMMPVLRFFPLPGSRTVDKARAKMDKLGRQIVDQSTLTMGDDLEKHGGKRDLLSVMLKANLSPDVPPAQRLSTEEAIAQIPTFGLAGHETTSTAVSWALHALSLHLDVQSKLRAELLSFPSASPTMDELNTFVYLEQVVREVMRLFAPILGPMRQALQDDIIPLGKPYVDKDGTVHDTLLIPRGQYIRIPILAVHTDTTIWGADAAEFRPERWDSIPAAAKEIPSVWANLLTFFAGPRNCIGFRFSLVEIKALLFTLLRTFEFGPAVPAGGIVPSSTFIQQPTVAAHREKGSCMPLLVKLYKA